MFYCPYHDYSMTRMAPITNEASIRFLHAVPGAAAVDVYVNGRLTASNLKYANFTNYFKFPGGYYEFKVYPAGKTEQPLIDSRIQLTPNSIYTIAAIGEPSSPSLYPILEPLLKTIPGHTMIRFAHLSPNAPSVDITLPDGKKLFKDVEYKEVTGYIPVSPGNYTIQARATGTNNVVLIIPNIHVTPNKILTIYAIGLANGKPPLQVLIPLDGSTYLRED